jgi:hypothetical protein
MRVVATLVYGEPAEKGVFDFQPDEGYAKWTEIMKYANIKHLPHKGVFDMVGGKQLWTSIKLKPEVGPPEVAAQFAEKWTDGWRP